MEKEEDRISKDYVFTKNEKGNLIFVGDFEGFYKKDKDPWGQKGSDDRLREYYAYSRKNLIDSINGLIASTGQKLNVLEIGCGLGYVLSEMNKSFDGKIKFTGMDISSTAIDKAKSLFPFLNFKVGNISDKHLKTDEKYDILIMSQVLWYVLEDFPQVFKNFNLLLKDNGHVIFINAFLKEQKYGKDIVDGFDGLVRYILVNYPKEYKLIKAEINYSDRFLHDDGILILKKAV